MLHSLKPSDMLDSDIDCDSFAMEMEVRDDGMLGPSWLGYYKHQTASPTANVTRGTRASPAPAYSIRAHSLHTSARQSCACIFLVILIKKVRSNLAQEIQF